MASERVQGLAAAYALLGQVPAAAREELGVELAIIAKQDILPEQQRLVAKRTGFLEGGLTVAAQIDQLRVRSGLFGIAGGRGSKRLLGSRYYGRFVNFGRRGQTVTVTRGRKAGGTGRTYRKNGRLRTVGAPYPMKVKAKAARPFIRVPGAEASAIRRLADYWSGVLGRAGTA